jgi:hypothetical protein
MSFMGTKSNPIERSIKAEEDHAWRQVRQFAVPYQCRKYPSPKKRVLFTTSNTQLRSEISRLGRENPFGDWERLFLSAAIDHFRDWNFELSARSAQRIFNEHQRQPFPRHFTQEKRLADLRADTKGSHEGNEDRLIASPFSHWPPHRWLVLL